MGQKMRSHGWEHACSPAPGRWKQEAQEFKASLGYLRPCLKQTSNNKKNKKVKMYTNRYRETMVIQFHKMKREKQRTWEKGDLRADMSTSELRGNVLVIDSSWESMVSWCKLKRAVLILAGPWGELRCSEAFLVWAQMWSLPHYELKEALPLCLCTGPPAILRRFMPGSAFCVCQSHDPENEKGWWRWQLILISLI